MCKTKIFTDEENILGEIKREKSMNGKIKNKNTINKLFFFMRYIILYVRTLIYRDKWVHKQQNEKNVQN